MPGAVGRAGDMTFVHSTCYFLLQNVFLVLDPLKLVLNEAGTAFLVNGIKINAL